MYARTDTIILVTDENTENPPEWPLVIKEGDIAAYYLPHY